MFKNPSGVFRTIAQLSVVAAAGTVKAAISAVASTGRSSGAVLPTALKHPRPIPERDLVLGPPSDRRLVSRQRDQIVSDRGDLLHHWARSASIRRPSRHLYGSGFRCITQFFPGRP